MKSTRTRQEHIEGMKAHWMPQASSWDAAVDYAIEQGMPVAPDPVDPVVGETFTAKTRLLQGMGVVFIGVIWQLRDGVWYSTVDGMTLPLYTTQLFTARIVYLLGVDTEPHNDDEDTSPYDNDDGLKTIEHETTVILEGSVWIMSCSGCAWQRVTSHGVSAVSMAGNHEAAYRGDSQ